MHNRKALHALFFFCLCLAVAGCATVSVKDQVLKDYEELTVLTPSSEITPQQAKLIAQKKLIDSFLYQNFQLAKPKIVDGPSHIPSAGRYWYVQFDESSKDSIPYIFMVVVEKHGGTVCFADDYPADKEWILESAVYGLEQLP